MNKVQMVEGVDGYHLLSELGDRTLCGQDATGVMIKLGSLVNVTCEECNFIYDMSRQQVHIGEDRAFERTHIINDYGEPYCGREGIKEVLVGKLTEVTCAECYKLFWKDTIGDWREKHGRHRDGRGGRDSGVPVVEADKAPPEVVSQPREVAKEMWDKLSPEFQWLLYKSAAYTNGIYSATLQALGLLD